MSLLSTRLLGLRESLQSIRGPRGWQWRWRPCVCNGWGGGAGWAHRTLARSFSGPRFTFVLRASVRSPCVLCRPWRQCSHSAGRKPGSLGRGPRWPCWHGWGHDVQSHVEGWRVGLRPIPWSGGISTHLVPPLTPAFFKPSVSNRRDRQSLAPFPFYCLRLPRICVSLSAPAAAPTTCLFS